MPLGTRQLLLYLRAEDQATRVITRVGSSIGGLGAIGDLTGKQMIGLGSALGGIGLAFTAAGAAGLAFFASSIKAAIEYRQEAALTLTQVHGMAASLEQIEQIGMRVAAVIPVPLKETQKSLYDIFSSMDVNLKQAEALLKAFSQAAVAGGTDVQTAAKATIAVLNAFKLPVSDVTQVLDTQFQMVRLGVGTYSDFAGAIGRVIPFAVQAGQTFQTMAGAMSFLTRQGQSTSQAATALARALDALTRTKAVERLKELGVAVYDAQGKTRPLIDIISDLAAKLNGMSPEKARDTLAAIFKGAGQIAQANRFLIPALNNVEGLRKMIQAMGNDAGGAAGAMAAAYKIMSNTPQAKIQALRNQWDLLRVNVGQALLKSGGPFMALIKGITDLIQKFNELTPKQRAAIVQWGLIASVLSLLVGLFLLAAGAALVFGGALVTAVGSMLGMELTLSELPTAIGLLGSAFADTAIGAGVLAAGFYGLAAALGIGLGVGLHMLIEKHFPALDRAFESMGAKLYDFGAKAGSVLSNFGGNLVNWGANIGNFFTNTFPHFFEGVGGAIADGLMTAGSVIARFVTQTVPHFFEQLPGKIVHALAKLGTTLASALGINLHKGLANVAGQVLGALASLPIRLVGFLLATGIRVVAAIVRWVDGARKAAEKLGSSVFMAIVHWFEQLPGRIVQFLGQMVGDFASGAAQIISWAIRLGTQVLAAIVRFFSQLPGRIISFIGAAASGFANFISNFVSTAISIGEGVFSQISTWIGKLPGLILNIGSQILQIILGWVTSWARAAADAAKAVWNAVKGALGIHSPSYIEVAFFNMERNVGDTLDRMRRNLPHTAGQMAADLNRQLMKAHAGINTSTTGSSVGGGIPSSDFGSSAGGVVIHGDVYIDVNGAGKNAEQVANLVQQQFLRKVSRGTNISDVDRRG